MAAVVQLRDVVERPEFWEELGRTATRDALLRIGAVLCGCATLDDDMRMTLLEARRTFVKRGNSLGHVSGGFQATPQSRVSFQRASTWHDTPLAHVECELAEVYKGISERSVVLNQYSEHLGNSSDDSISEIALTVPQMMPWPLFSTICPGLGPRWLHYFWVCLVASIALFETSVTIYCHGVEECEVANDGYTVARLTMIGRYLNRGGSCIVKWLCLPALFGMHRIVNNEKLIAAIWQKRATDCKEFNSALRRIHYIVFGLFVFWMALEIFWPVPKQKHVGTTFWTSWEAWPWVLSQLFFMISWAIYFTVVCAFLLVVSIVWKVTSDEVDVIRSEIASGRVTDWATLTRQYNSLENVVSDWWAQECLGGATAGILLALSIDFLVSMCDGMVGNRFWVITYDFAWAIVDISTIFAILFVMADVARRCQSTSPHAQSILGLALQHCGSVPAHQRLDHDVFIRCVKHKTLGIVLSPIGKVKVAWVGFYAKLIALVLPVLIGVALKKHV